MKSAFPSWVLTVIALIPMGVHAGDLECTNWQQAHPDWLWCDDFESDASLEQSYFEVDRAAGRFGVSNSNAFGGQASLKATYMPGQANSGGVKLAVGRNPITGKYVGSGDYQELYWRIYMKVSPNWVGNPQKVSRAIVFAASNWSEAAIGHVWEDSNTSLGIGIDPVSGVVGSQVVTTQYNDFSHFRWLGMRNATTQIYAGSNRDRWFCIETRMRLNTLNVADGVFDLWIDGNKEASATGLDWRGGWNGYGINAIFLENFKNGSAAQLQERYMDNFVVSRSPIGCVRKKPNPPTDVIAQ